MTDQVRELRIRSGTPSHLAMEYFRLHAGFEAIHVPYRSVAPTVVDFLAGQVKIAFGSAGIAAHIREGRLKGLAVSHAGRSSLAPDIPTMAESGYPGFTIETYLVLISPAGISEPVWDCWSASYKLHSIVPI